MPTPALRDKPAARPRPPCMAASRKPRVASGCLPEQGPRPMQLALDFPADEADPVLAEVIRGDMVESVHRGAVAIVDARGGVVARIGDIDRPVFARSAIKPLQALPLIETGA